LLKFEQKKEFGANMAKQKGFSLIELLIVVAIILVIAAIAVPNLIKSKMAANESSAVGSIRTIVTGELTYANTSYVGSGYQTLANLGSAGLIDSTLAAGTKSGFSFTANPASSGTQFIATAGPVTPGSSGINYYCAVEDAVIHRPPSQITSHDTCASDTNPLNTQ
jgi:prepilin-type N-terminal cleavage/methylation domain-containing protein